MKKILITLFILMTMILLNKQTVFADCPCNPCGNPCDSCSNQGDYCSESCMCPYDSCYDCCCEGWLDCKCLEDYYCRIGLCECQKCEARKAVEEFKCCTQCLRAKNCKCEKKSECRQYRKALRDLDCRMRSIINRCQKCDYKSVRGEIKEKVKCCHKCFIWPFYLCKCNFGCTSKCSH